MAWNPEVNELFLKALELRSGAERQAYLDGACGTDAALRAEVESLLQASARAGSFLESPAPAPELVPTVDRPPVAERPGTAIGPYKLLEQIGEGGFGVVFMAEQTQPVRRKVALKVLKPGMDTRQVVARFEAERQALAIMDHPNIARHHAVRQGAAAEGDVRRDPPHHPRGGAAPAQDPHRHPGTGRDHCLDAAQERSEGVESTVPG